MEESNIDVRLALEEMRFNMKQSLDAGDALDQKLSQILAASGAVLALVTALQLTLSSTQSDLYWAVFLVAVGLYVFAVFLALIGASPQSYRLAIASEWEELDKQIFGKLERDIALILLSGYVDQIQHNRNINRRKANIYRLSLIVLPLTVTLLVVLVRYDSRSPK